jgi:hypothetical protein
MTVVHRGRPRNLIQLTNHEKNKRWRLRNPVKWRICSALTKQRHNDESQIFATSSGNRWDSSEIKFIKDHAAIMTARNIAYCLGRSYTAVITKSCREKITLMTNDKRHGILRTGN